MEQQSHTNTDSSLIHVLKPIYLLGCFFFFFFFFASPHSICTFPQRTGWKERCPKECVYKLPINTLTHALMHTHTRTPTVYIPLVSSLQAIPSVSVGHAPSSQPRRGTFGSSFSGKNRQNKTKMSDVIFCHLLFREVQTYRVQFGILPGTKTSQQVKVPSLSLALSFFSIHLAA